MSAPAPVGDAVAALQMNIVIEVRTGDDAADATLGQLLRVLYVGPADGDVLVIDILSKVAWPHRLPRSEVEARLCADSLRVVSFRTLRASGAPLPSEQELNGPRYRKQRNRRDRRYAVIQSLLDPTTGVLADPRPNARIAEAAAAHHASPANVRVWLRRYWQGGQTPLALLGDYDRCGSPGRRRTPAPGQAYAKLGRKTNAARAGETDPASVGVNVDPVAREKLRRGVRFLKAGKGPTEAYNDTLEAEFYLCVEHRNGVAHKVPEPGVVYPTLDQFRYHVRDLWRPEDAARATEGRRYNLTRRPRLNTSTDMAEGPGSVYQVDATVADAYLVSQLDRLQVIGRPIIYLLVDMWSRMITGLHVSLGAPSWPELALALLQAFSDKVAFCAGYGRAIQHDDWPCVGVMERLMGDRGEPVAKDGDHVVRALTFAMDTTASWRADWKGIVENDLKFLPDSAMRWMPGYVLADAAVRGAPDYRKQARYTLPGFTRRMIEYVLWYNNARPVPRTFPIPRGFGAPGGRRPCPADLWRWGVRHRTGALRMYDDEFLRANVMRAKMVRPQREGLVLRDGVRYTCATGVAEGWFVGGAGVPPVALVADPRRLGTAYVRDPQGSYERAVLTGDSARFEDWSSNEVEDYFVRADNAEQQGIYHRRSTRADRNFRVALIDREEVDGTEAALVAAGLGAPSVRDIKSHRREERIAVARTVAGEAGVRSTDSTDDISVAARPAADSSSSPMDAGRPPAAAVPTARPSHYAALRAAVFGSVSAENGATSDVGAPDAPR